MKIDAMLVCKTVPAWAAGKPLHVMGEPNGPFLLIVAEKPTLIYPRWYHRLGQKLGWNWLTYLGGIP